MKRALLMVFAHLAAAMALHADRVALVIGNSAYAQPELKLTRPANDAAAIRTLLKSAKFAVAACPDDRNREQLEDCITSFAKAATKAEAALIYYAGHAIQVNGENYLWPVDEPLPAPADVPKRFLSMSTIYQRLGEAQAAANIVILDACRNNPYYSRLAHASDWTPGLAPPRNAPSRTLVAYATSPGKLAAEQDDDAKGKHSPYTRALLAHLGAPGITIDAVLREVREDVTTMTEGDQTPWETTSLLKDFYVVPPVYVNAAIHGVDDEALVIVNGNEALSSNRGGRQVPILLRGGENVVAIKVYNQHTFTGGIEGFGGHKPEGWRIHASFSIGDKKLVEIQENEDEPPKDGSRHGHLFTASTFILVVDPVTGDVRVSDLVREAWRSE
jgi:hypothetical protein